MNERRKQHRRHLIFYLRLLDASQNKLLGYLGDISPEGLLMISEQPYAVGRTLAIRMLLPRPMEGQESIEFKATVRRCAPDYNPQFYAVGMEVEQLPDDALKILAELLQEMGFKD